MDSENLLRLLIAHHSSHEAECLLNILRKAGYATRPVYVDNAAEIRDVLEKGKWDLVLSADHLKDGDLRRLMGHYTATQKDLPVIIVSASGDEDILVNAMHLGARDCVAWDRPRHLLEAVRRELAELDRRRQRRLCESSLRELKRRNSALLAASRKAVAFVLDGMHIHANLQYAQLFGLEDPTELAQFPVMDLVAAADRQRFRDFLKSGSGDKDAATEAIELAALRGDRTFPALFNISPSVYEGEACHQVVVTSLEPAAPERAAAAPSDPVERLLELLEERVLAAIKGQRRSCLVYGELDNFAVLRRGLGVAGTHQLVGELINTLQERLGEEVTVSRCGDSAIALVIDDPELKASAGFAEQVRELVSTTRVQPRDRSPELTLSLGAVNITELTPSGQAALDHAVEACQEAAAAGGNRLVAHERPKSVTPEHRVELVAKGIQRLLKRKRKVLRFRPIVGLHGHRREFYEVIPRLADAEDRPYPTDEVYRTAEAAGLAPKFDQWMVDRVIELTTQRITAGRDICFILGLSDQAMADADRVLSVAKALKRNNIAGERLVFRLGEAAASSNIKSSHRFATGLHEVGCKVALTHFGSGLNPFRILERVDADYLAFDAAFIQDITRNQESRQAVEMLCDEAKDRAKLTLAPGVRDADTLAVLWQCGVDYASGDYLQEAGPEMSYDFQAEA